MKILKDIKYLPQEAIGWENLDRSKLCWAGAELESGVRINNVDPEWVLAFGEKEDMTFFYLSEIEGLIIEQEEIARYAQKKRPPMPQTMRCVGNKGYFYFNAGYVSFPNRVGCHKSFELEVFTVQDGLRKVLTEDLGITCECFFNRQQDTTGYFSPYPDVPLLVEDDILTIACVLDGNNKAMAIDLIEGRIICVQDLPLKIAEDFATTLY